MKSSSGEKREPKKKKPYTKPEVKQVLLKPEEAVLGACKMTGKTGHRPPVIVVSHQLVQAQALSLKESAEHPGM